MNELQVFNNDQFGSVRTINEDGAVLFCGSDVAKALGYSRPNDAVSAHCRCTAKRRIATAQGNESDMSFIPEGDVYRLIVRSNLPAAEKFEKWVFEEVLPTIRKHGMWVKDELLNNPDALLEVVTKLKEEHDARKALEVQNAALLPKGEYYDALVDRNLCTSFRDTAKLIGIGERAFIFALLDDKYIYRDLNGRLSPYAKANNGYFEVKEFTRGEHAGLQTLVTVKGREHFMKLYGSESKREAR